MPFAVENYGAAYVVFMVASLAALMASLAVTGRVTPGLALCLAVSPAVMFAAVFGQNGLWTSALLIVIAFARDRRPILAGIAVGLLTMKPQFGVLIPLVLIIEHNWRCLAVAAITTAALLAATTLWLGADIWQAYFAIFSADHPVVREMGQNMGALKWQISPFAGFQAVGLGRTAAALCSVVVLLAAAVVLYINRHLPDRLLKAALFIACTYLAAPYTGIYDLAALAWVGLVMLFREVGKPAPSMTVILACLAAFGLPVIAQHAAPFHLPVAALVLGAFTAVIAGMVRAEARRVRAH